MIYYSALFLILNFFSCILPQGQLKYVKKKKDRKVLTKKQNNYESLLSITQLQNTYSNLFLLTLINSFNSGYCQNIEYDNLHFNQRRRLIEDGPIIKTPDNQTLCQFQIAEVIENNLSFGTFLVNDDMPFYALKDINNNQNVILIRCMDLLCQQQNISIIENDDDNIIFNNIPATLNNNIPIILYQTRNDSNPNFRSNTFLIDCLDKFCKDIISTNISLETYTNSELVSTDNQLIIVYKNVSDFLIYNFCQSLFCNSIFSNIIDNQVFSLRDIDIQNNVSTIFFVNLNLEPVLVFCQSIFCSNFTKTILNESLISSDFDYDDKNLIKIVYVSFSNTIDIINCLDFFCNTYFITTIYTPPIGNFLGLPKIETFLNLTYIIFFENNPSSYRCLLLVLCYDSLCNNSNIYTILNSTSTNTISNSIQLDDNGLPVMSFSFFENLTQIATCIAPTLNPTTQPSDSPSLAPTLLPTKNSSNVPTIHPMQSPSLSPTTLSPSASETNNVSGLGIGLILGLLIIFILLIIFCFEYCTNNKYQRI